MRITLFGATGRTGSYFMRKALKDGHVINAFTRNKERLYLENDNLNIVEGDVLDPDAVEEAIRGVEAVVVTLGADDISKPIRMLSEGNNNIVNAMRKMGVKRYIGVVGAGVLDDPSGSFRGEVELPPFLQFVFADQIRVFEILRSSNLNWTLVCPTFMPEGNETGNLRHQKNYIPENPKPVNVGDVANLMYKILVDNIYIKERVGVAS